MTNEGLDETVAEILDGLGQPERAAMMRANHQSAEDLHIECTDSDALAAILDAVLDSGPRVRHSAMCWRTHAACLRDRIYADLGWG
jgi:hypothetical protein